jgi:hypothetical protein
MTAPTHKRMVGWVAVYDLWDGQPLRVFNSWDVAFRDLPDDGMQGLIKFYEDGTKQIVSGFDWYFAVQHPTGSWVISGNNHDPEETQQRYPGAILKRGKHTTDEWAHLVDSMLVAVEKPEGCKGC